MNLQNKHPFPLQGKIAIVTGANGGIGNLLVEELRKEGVVCICVDKEGIPSDNFLLCDFSQEDDVEKLVEQIRTKFDKIDFLFNVAGVGIYKNITELDITEWKNSLAINLTSPFILTKGLIPLLKKSDTSFVLNFGSGMGKIPSAGRVAYCASKFGLRGMSLSLNKELKDDGVDISLLTLGSVMTNFGSGGIKFRKEQEKIGKKYLTPQEVVKKVMNITLSNRKAAEYIFYPTGYASPKFSLAS